VVAEIRLAGYIRSLTFYSIRHRITKVMEVTDVFRQVDLLFYL